jgi:methylated-DNA-[protein]-cysteine S-methyltransferase
MWSVVTSPVGDLRVVGRETDGDVAISAIEFAPWSSASGRPVGDRVDAHPVLAAACAQLTGYFAGDLTEFDLPLAAEGTEFQQRVWDQLVRIGYGETASYGDIARRLGMSAAASRAVGLANGRNPIAIVVPCHRVIGANGKIVGYGGGVHRKQALLELEQGSLF